ncbi:multiple organellar RNA editing factor 2, chloroplastic-like [Ananas comosus]|uniref:Multiple organellar RNA editing factor 2, chloroplastic-like n=1 Tax=Ananas comosus TaxID=4615 RepID=A0A6P5FG01_ANACO|nr:multiple organellar RNA editing factor 2, chloroplastic-like [Ananas comosus]
MAIASTVRSLLSSPSRSPFLFVLSNRFSSSSSSASSSVAGLFRFRASPIAAPHPGLALRLTAARLVPVRFAVRRPGGDAYSPLKSGGGGGGGGGSGFSDRPPTEMAPLFPGCDYEHWLIVMDKPGGEGATKQQMIDCYVQTLAKVLGSEEEAKKKIYNVSCERYFGFGCEIDEETSNKLEGLPGVLFVLPDSYVDAEYKDYGAELFVNGEVVQRPLERQRRIDSVLQRSQERTRHNDRTRYVRRRENQR